MSLYYLQKALYQLNRDPELRRRFSDEPDAGLAAYELTAEEREALLRGTVRPSTRRPSAAAQDEGNPVRPTQSSSS